MVLRQVEGLAGVRLPAGQSERRPLRRRDRVDRPATDGTEISRWLPYVSVDDVDAAISRATSAGGAVAVSALDVDLGRVAAILDPEGAAVGLSRSKVGDPDDAYTRAAHGRVVWTELIADDASSAADFYEKVVGLAARTIDRRGGEYTLLSRDGRDRAGILPNPTQDWKPQWLTYFAVNDPAAAAQKAESLGGTILLAPTSEIRDGNLALVSDPSGAVLALQKLTI